MNVVNGAREIGYSTGMRHRSFLGLTTALVAAASLAACSASDGGSGPTGGAGGHGAADGGAEAGGGGLDGGGDGGSGAGPSEGGLLDQSVADVAQTGPSLVYAHTDTTLFQLDPTSPTLALTTIGDFDCIGGSGNDTAMTDLAVDESQALWGISANAVHPLAIQGGAVHCAAPIALNNPKAVHFYGLSFAPAGVLDPAKEVLVGGNTAGELWAIDAQGNLSQRGTFGTVPTDDGNGHPYPKANVGKPWELSGDIVFLTNGGSPVGFATVRDCPNPPSATGCNATNTLLEIDVPALASATTQSVAKAIRGQIVKRAGCADPTTSFGNVYGIAAWEAQVYGFSRTGDLVAIDTSDGSGCLVQAYASDKFAGAGVTTLAPVKPPPPK